MYLVNRNFFFLAVTDYKVVKRRSNGINKKKTNKFYFYGRQGGGGGPPQTSPVPWTHGDVWVRTRCKTKRNYIISCEPAVLTSKILLCIIFGKANHPTNTPNDKNMRPKTVSVVGAPMSPPQQQQIVTEFRTLYVGLSRSLVPFRSTIQVFFQRTTIVSGRLVQRSHFKRIRRRLRHRQPQFHDTIDLLAAADVDTSFDVTT